MPIRMNDHVNEVGIVKGQGGLLEACFVEGPTGRPEFPEQPAKRLAIFDERGTASFAMEVVLIPQAMLIVRRVRFECARKIMDVIAPARDQSRCTLRPKSRNDARATSAP